MHWGELDTVLHYYATESLMPAWSTSRRPRYLYAATLRPGVAVNPTAFVENQSVDEHVEILAAAASQGPTRYLNTREVPGSVSLVALKTDFTPIHCIDLWNQVNSSGIMLPPPPPEEA
ncbi:hypothetical protein [Microbacterium sp.]|uniref:hypothetical protein n=1 Tax=Microbacterium sp. TaxID=51671 RepID=UPI0032426600